jgi:diguanylate cyclase (GGDEF)-like protein
MDRDRLLDMTRRIRPAGAVVVLICAPISILLVSRVGPAFLLPYAIVAAFTASAAALARNSRPELWLFGGDCVVATAIAADAALTGGAASPVLPALAIPLVAVAGRHSARALSVYFAFTIAAALLACLFATNGHVALEDLRLPCLLTTFAGLFVIMLALMRADAQYHRDSLLDPLTGLLNRLALEHKFRELNEQAVSRTGSLCVIAADIDHFKRVNDSYGHARGDAVLREVAGALRERLRAFSLAYRTGGEEFAIVLPGVNLDEGTEIAERLRAAIAQDTFAGLRLTMSFGVAAVTADAELERVLRDADRCLYAAKRGGRNRVVAIGPDGAGAPALRQAGVGRAGSAFVGAQ